MSRLKTGLLLSVCLALGAGALMLAPLLEAGNGSARQAIEQLENCQRGEKGCVKILKQRRKNGLLEIKAQVRGGRIIWYVYDPDSGRVRRMN